MLGATTSTIYFVYILESLRDSKRYTGFTTNLGKRLKEHQWGLSLATKPRLPMKLIYFEDCLSVEDSKRREIYLKTTRGRRFLAKRLKTYYQSKL